MAADDLGERVDGDVAAVLEGVEDRRRRDGVVDDEGDLVPVGHIGQRLHVVHVALGVADALGEDQAGVGVNRRLDVGRLGRVDEAHLDAEAFQGVLEKHVGAAVEV